MQLIKLQKLVIYDVENKVFRDIYWNIISVDHSTLLYCMSRYFKQFTYSPKILLRDQFKTEEFQNGKPII